MDEHYKYITNEFTAAKVYLLPMETNDIDYTISNTRFLMTGEAEMTALEGEGKLNFT